MSDRDHIDALKAAADPKRVAAALGLRGHGGRFFCPACQSDGARHKTPDLAVRGKGFVCFKCGLKGDLLKLVEVALGLDFPKAVEWLERETAIGPPYRKRGTKGGCRDSGRPNKTSYKRSWGPSLSAVGSEGPKTGSAPDPAVYEAFLAACRPVEGAALAWLTREKGVASEVVEACRLRFCGREYLDVMDRLKTRFGEDALLAAGLLKRSDKGKLVPSFWHYWTKRAGFLVIPYLLNGRPVYLKARPPVSKDKAERLGLVRFLNTAAAVPCLYNADALTAQPIPDKVLVCEGESDTWTALSAGFAAVGSPGAKSFKPAWVEGFRAFVDAGGRSRVYLVPDADAAGAEGARVIADLFLKAGLPVPLKVTIPAGKDLNEYLKTA
jgi:hypothetical protein